DTQEPIDVHVYADGYVLGEALANLPRRDVNAAYPSQTGYHGYDATFAVSPGNRMICVVAENVSFGSHQQLGRLRVNIAAPAPAPSPTPVPNPPAPEPAQGDLGAVYRFWSDTYQGHFYTRSVAERDKLITGSPSHIWRYEGVMFGAYGSQVEGTVPLYRFWS